jgi:hypothetical protein
VKEQSNSLIKEYRFVLKSRGSGRGERELTLSWDFLFEIIVIGGIWTTKRHISLALCLRILSNKRKPMTNF